MTTRRAYSLINIFEVWLAFGAIVGAIGFWTIPGASDISVTQTAGILAQLWNSMYLIGGIFTAIGLILASPRSEVIGMLFFGPALVVNGVCVLIAHKGQGVISAAMVIGLAIACIIRTDVLVRAFKIE